MGSYLARGTVLSCILAFVIGCSTWDDRREREEANYSDAMDSYGSGSDRDDVLLRFPKTSGFFDGMRLYGVGRPEGGWEADLPLDRGSIAFRYERKYGVVIRAIDVIERPRFRKPYWFADITPGIWWDYLLFDDELTLRYVHRRFID